MRAGCPMARFEVAASRTSRGAPEWIHQFHPRGLEIGNISRDHNSTSHEGRGCDLKIGAIVSQYR